MINADYVKKIDDDGKIYYTKTFYAEIRKRVIYGHMSRMEALRSLGFAPEKLGIARARQATYRAMKKAEKFSVSGRNPQLSFKEILATYAEGKYEPDELLKQVISYVIVEEELKGTNNSRNSRIRAADNFIRGDLRKKLGLNKQQCFNLFGVAKSAHYKRCKEGKKTGKRKKNDDNR